MKNLPLLLGTLVGTVALIAGVVFFFSGNATPQTVEDQTQLVSESPHVRGPEDAEVTIVEFSDFQCPACAAAEPLVTNVLTQYPDKVRLIYRNFPLTSIHQNAQLAAQAAETAAQDDKYWEYHDVLFAEQAAWSQITDQDQFKDQLGTYAEELGIDKASFLERIESDQIKQAVATDIAAASQLRIQATPTFFVNGQQTPASQLLTTVESLINN